MNHYKNLFHFYGDKTREEISLENLFAEVRKYDTYFFNPMERSTMSKEINPLNEVIEVYHYSYHCNFSSFIVEKAAKREDYILVFNASKDEYNYQSPSLRICMKEIIKVEKWITGRYKHDENWLLFHFKDGTDLAILCSKISKKERDMSLKYRRVLQESIC